MKMSLETVLGIIIGAVFVIIIGFVIVSLVKMMLPQKIDEATMSSFEEIVRVVKSFESKKIPIDINPPYIIVGFSKGAFINIPDYTGRGVFVERLDNPCKKACLCICPTTERSESKSIITSPSMAYNSCFKYKKKCVEFDNINSLIGDVGYEEYLVLTPYKYSPGVLLDWTSLPTIYEVSLSPDKDTNNIKFDFTESK